MLALAASAGAHAALVPSHAAETPQVGVLFAVSALVLGGVSVLVDRSERRAVVGAAGLLLGGLRAVCRIATPVSYTHLTLPTTPYV